MNPNQNPQQMQIKITDEMAKGAYANMMAVNHGPDAFTLDFISVQAPVTQVVARVITSPAHLKQIIGALQENLKRYETRFGELKEVPAITQPEASTSTQEKPFGFQP